MPLLNRSLAKVDSSFIYTKIVTVNPKASAGTVIIPNSVKDDLFVTHAKLEGAIISTIVANYQ